jgi:DnaJ-domain-containing protein 1
MENQEDFVPKRLNFDELSTPKETVPQVPPEKEVANNNDDRDDDRNNIRNSNYRRNLIIAKKLIKSHDGANAMKRLSDAIVLFPTSVEAKLLLAVATFIDGNWSGIISSDITKGKKSTINALALIQACSKELVTPSLALRCANMLFNGGYLSCSILFLKETQKCYGTSPFLLANERLLFIEKLYNHFHAGVSFYKYGNFSEACVIFSSILKEIKQPDLIALVLTHRAAAYIGLREPHSGLVDSKKAMRIRGRFLKAKVVYARALLTLGRSSESMSELLYVKNEFPCDVIIQEYKRAEAFHVKAEKQNEQNRREQARARERTRENARKERENRARTERQHWRRNHFPRSFRQRGYTNTNCNKKENEQENDTPPKSDHQILGVKLTAGKITVKKAFKKLARIYHPDKNSQPGAEEMFKKINQAYSNIKSPPLSRYSSYPY